MVAQVRTYASAVDLINEVGFLPLSKNPYGFLSLEECTAESSWHTGEETDPWEWKDRVTVEHKAAYSRVMNKRLSFVSLAWYPTFISAYKSPLPPAERYAEGLLSPTARKLYECLDGCLPLGTHELKQQLSVTKENTSAFESALSELQCGFDITVSGKTQKIGKNGEPYGWPSSAYTTVEQWSGEELLEQAIAIPRSDAIERIANRIRELAPHLGEKEIAKFMGVRALK